MFFCSVKIVGAVGIATILGACSEHAPAPDQTREPQASASAQPPPFAHDTGDAAPTGSVANAKNASNADAAVAPLGVDGPFIGALYMQTPVMSDMEWAKEDRKPGDRSGATRLGYIRQGSRVAVIAEPHPKSNCKEGWYELVQGGFVCGKYASLDLNHPRIKFAPHPPYTDSPLPYDYGYNLTNGTPLYRQIPSREERMELEPWLAARKPKPRHSAQDETTETADAERDAGAALALTRATTSVEPLGSDALDAGVPWYLRDYDGGKPQITLDELKGEGTVARRMVKGFYLALDKSFESNGAKWWRTTGSLVVPFDRVYVNKIASDLGGLWLNAPAQAQPAQPQVDAGPNAQTNVGASPEPNQDICQPNGKAQVGIILSNRAHKYAVSASRRAITTGDPVARHTVIRLTGDRVTVNGVAYNETDEGWWMKATEGTRTKPADAPKDLLPNEKWIDINLTLQTLVAFEGTKAVFATAVSTGKKNEQDKEKDHRTPVGSFRIREKHIAATMDGDVASDGPYSIEDVPWIMYFNGSYALHGAFWHNDFGRTKSHGCINLAPKDAKALFGWTEPRLPDGWHGVWSGAQNPGTRVVVHD
ncbi:MAG: L,D-transpeptidase [Polyangiaceae bacterium]|nr:L,D-transpeptidase [Polyangiaceae bacterium]